MGLKNQSASLNGMKKSFDICFSLFETSALQWVPPFALTISCSVSVHIHFQRKGGEESLLFGSSAVGLLTA
jgi:hypothetical protein